MTKVRVLVRALIVATGFTTASLNWAGNAVAADSGKPVMNDPAGRTLEQQICAGRRVDFYRYMSAEEQAQANLVHKSVCARLKIPYVPPLASTGVLGHEPSPQYLKSLATHRKVCAGHRGSFYQSFTPEQKTNAERTTRTNCENSGVLYLPPKVGVAPTP